jgi:hypothetical protein
VTVQANAYIIRPYAPVAQLDRVTGFEPVGREFESLWARQLSFLLLLLEISFPISRLISTTQFRL